MKQVHLAALLFSLLGLVSVTGHAAEFCSASYTLTLQNKTQLAQQAEQQFTLKAQLTLQSAKLESETNWWTLTINQAMLSMAGLEQVEPSYQHAFSFQLDDKGLIKQFLFDPALNPQTKEKLKGFAYYFQLPVKQAKKNNYWLKDGIGKFQAKLEQQERGLMLTKEYYDVASMLDNSAVKGIDITRSEHLFQPAKCLYKQVSGEESLSFKGQSDALNMRSEQQYQLKQIQANSLAANQILVLERKLAQQPAPLSTQEKLTLEQSFKQFLQQDLTKIEAFHLAKLLQQYSQVLDVLHPILANNTLSDASQMRLFNALGQLDNRYSQVFLLTVLNKEYATANTQFRAIRALAQGQKPLTNEAYALIETRVQEGVFSSDEAMHGNFILALGTIIGAREENNYSNLLKTLLSDQLQTSTTEKDKARVLSAMGNSQQVSYTDTLISYSNSSSPQLKNAAFRALGQVKSEDAQLRLSAAIEETLPTKSTQTALNALANYQYPANTKVKVLELAKSADDDDIRYAAINALATQKADKETIKKELRALLKGETSRRNFNAIVKTLHSKND